MKISFLVFTLPLFCTLLAADSVPQRCEVEGDEEYAVIAAVLFPNDPDIPGNITDSLQREAYIEMKRVRLDGFHGSSYLIQGTSIPSEIKMESDSGRTEDFNKRNGRSCRFLEEKLQKYLTPNERVRFFYPEEDPNASPVPSSAFAVEREIENRGLSDNEVVRLSRPGFDRSKTYAVIEVDLQAGRDMGVGYRVYLEKSPKSGKWIIAGADRTRIY